MSVRICVAHMPGTFVVIADGDVLATFNYTETLGGGAKAINERRARDFAAGMVQGLEMARRMMQGAYVLDIVSEAGEVA